MEPARYNFNLWQGKTKTLSLTLKDNGVVRPLSTYQARMQIKSDYGGTVYISLDSDSGGGIVLADTSPNIVVTITDEQSAALDFVQGVYDLEIESAGGDVDGPLYGRVTLKKEVTTS